MLYKKTLLTKGVEKSDKIRFLIEPEKMLITVPLKHSFLINPVSYNILSNKTIAYPPETLVFDVFIVT